MSTSLSIKNRKDETMLSMADGRIWRKAKSLPYKHTIVAYGAAIAGLPSQIAYGGWQKSAMALPFNNIDIR